MSIKQNAYRIQISLAIGVAIVAALTAQPASALTYPMGHDDVVTALEYGRIHTVAQLMEDPMWFRRAPDDDGGAGPTLLPTITLMTPSFLLAWLSAEANAKYEEPDKHIVQRFKNASSLIVSVDLFSYAVHGDDDAACVIQQNGKIIHGRFVSLSGATVISEPAVGYRRTAAFAFAFSTFKYDSRFNVIVANIPIRFEATGKRVFEIDPVQVL